MEDWQIQFTNISHMIETWCYKIRQNRPMDFNKAEYKKVH